MKTGCLITSCLGVLMVVCLCGCLGLVAFGITSGTEFDYSWEFPSITFSYPTPVPNFVRPEVDGVPVVIPSTTREQLETIEIPTSDLRVLAQELRGASDIPTTFPVDRWYEVGDRKQFWLSNNDTNESYQVVAELQYSGEVVNFWVEEGVEYDPADLEALATTFEQQIYPTVRSFFGSEWLPGIDEDPRLYILYATNLGSSIAGYFSSVDEYPPAAHAYSNAHEMFFLNADVVGLGEEYTYGVLAHEFQHMIQWNQDSNEDTWMDEGFAELAAFLAGYDPGGFDRLYTRDPDLPITDWPGGDEDSSAYYGGSFLFMTYLKSRFGSEFLQNLVSHQENGLASVDQALAAQPPDPLREGLATPPDHSPSDEVFQDFTLALYLDNPDLADGRYVDTVYPGAPLARDTETLRTCPMDPTLRTVYQYGVDYIRIDCPGTYTLRFEGSTLAQVTPVDAHSGQFMFWSNRSNEAYTTLTRTFDFRNHLGPLTLSYWTWYDLEKDFDYVFLLVSLDGGQSWDILRTPSGTGEDPNGNNYGWGYNGESGRWIEETVDLSEYAGQEVQVRFANLTDAGVTTAGFLVDDLRIPELGYAEDFEAGAGDWQPEGFARIENALPQRFLLALIEENGARTVRYLSVPEDNQIEITLAQESVLVVSAATRYTLQPATYRLSILP